MSFRRWVGERYASVPAVFELDLRRRQPRILGVLSVGAQVEIERKI